MKMAKASEADIDAAGELCKLLNELDEGNRWSSGALGDTVDFFEIEDFDPEKKAHLESLYDKLMNLMHAQPSFHNRVIGGMCYVIMYDANEIIDPNSDHLDLHPRFSEAFDDLARETQAARYWNMRYHQVAQELVQMKLSAQRISQEWATIWSPIDEIVRPLTPLGESVSAKAVELINTAMAMAIPKQEPDKQGYFSYDCENGFDLFDTAQDAESAAQKSLDSYREWAHEGWDEGVQQVCWGKLHGSITSENCGQVEFEGEMVEAVNYKLFRHPTPAQAAAIPDWENEAKRAFWCGLEIGVTFGATAILPRWDEYIAKRKGELSEPKPDSTGGERPILFSAPMVRALLDGSKTQTRRVVKGMAFDWVENAKFSPEFVARADNDMCPYGKIGDRLWVRESWQVLVADHHNLYIGFAATDCAKGIDREMLTGEQDQQVARFEKKSGFVPSIHMPRWASRINLEITAVRVERLNDISDADAMAEGFPFNPKVSDDYEVHRDASRDWFSDLWESINGAGSWQANPWVWVVEFKVVV